MRSLRPDSQRLPADPDRAPLPHPGQLAAVGTLLCLHRPALGDALEGWARAVAVAAMLHVDSDGVRESLCFYDREGQCCWRLCLLPDSDFLAWDRLLAPLPAVTTDADFPGVGERLWRRLAGCLRGEQWRLSALRLHAAGGLGGELAASLATVSALGATVARRIARDEGIDGPLAIDDCCCARAAAAARREAGEGDGDPFPLVRLPG